MIAASPHMAPCAGHTVITGGMGALGSLVGAWLQAGAQHTKRCSTLLGRTGRVSGTSVPQLFAQAQQQVCDLLVPMLGLCHDDGRQKLSPPHGLM